MNENPKKWAYVLENRIHDRSFLNTFKKSKGWFYGNESMDVLALVYSEMGDVDKIDNFVFSGYVASIMGDSCKMSFAKVCKIASLKYNTVNDRFLKVLRSKNLLSSHKEIQCLCRLLKSNGLYFDIGGFAIDLYYLYGNNNWTKKTWAKDFYGTTESK